MIDKKRPWDMTLLELVDEWGGGGIDDGSGSVSDEQRNYYLWDALARDIEEIKKFIKTKK